MESTLRSAETGWPLATEVGFERVPAEWRAALAERAAAILQRHVIDPWFPRVLDRQVGGFHSDFDRRWRQTGPDERMLEYQVRMTRSAARLGLAFPHDRRWLEYARHGARYIDEVMRDRRSGGWFWLVDRDGKPLANGSKTAHSAAYVISCLVEVARLTGDEGALEMAYQTFEWLDASLHDREHGGYHGWATREGRPILDLADAGDWSRDVDPLGHEVGLKDANVHSDLLESFRLLYADRPTPTLLARLTELYEVTTRHFIGSDGQTSYLLRPDLSPVDGVQHPGYTFQCAFRIPLVAPLIGKDPRSELDAMRRPVDLALAIGWNERGGGVFEKLGPPRERRRAWWVQVEAIQALLLFEVCIGPDAYRERIDALFDLVEREYLDQRYGGWYSLPTSETSVIDRLLARRRPKAHRWKDVSHETEIGLSALRMLRGLPAGAPIRL